MALFSEGCVDCDYVLMCACLTNKLRSPKDVLELVSGFDLMSDPKVNQLDSGVGDILVQQHDVFRLHNIEHNTQHLNNNEKQIFPINS